jgi:hypothetical protein
MFESAEARTAGRHINDRSDVDPCDPDRSSGEKPHFVRNWCPSLARVLKHPWSNWGATLTRATISTPLPPAEFSCGHPVSGSLHGSSEGGTASACPARRHETPKILVFQWRLRRGRENQNIVTLQKVFCVPSPHRCSAPNGQRAAAKPLVT